MNTIEKEFVHYELAVKLKELGFDEECLSYYFNKQLSFGSKTSYGQVVEAPLYQQAFRWFREKYMLVGVPTHQSYDIWNTITGECFIEIYPLNSYEEAELECLKKLIEIVEQKK